MNSPIFSPLPNFTVFTVDCGCWHWLELFAAQKDFIDKDKRKMEKRDGYYRKVGVWSWYGSKDK